MLILILLKNIIWLIYFITYTIILLIINIIFQFLKISYNFYINIQSSNLQLIYIFLFFNIARLPPTSFFFIKWFRIYLFIFNSNFFIIFIIILINSFILIYIYINIITLLLFFYSTKSKLICMTNLSFKKIYLLLFIRFFLSLFIVLI